MQLLLLESKANFSNLDRVIATMTDYFLLMFSSISMAVILQDQEDILGVPAVVVPIVMSSRFVVVALIPRSNAWIVVQPMIVTSGVARVLVFIAPVNVDFAQRMLLIVQLVIMVRRVIDFSLAPRIQWWIQRRHLEQSNAKFWNSLA